jgi:phospholipid/cholesterol/gamma-HCH transport system permease protein
VRAVGAATLGLLRATGALAIFAAQALLAAVSPPWHARQILQQVVRIGFYSLPVVGVTAVFIGAALALNIYTGGARFNAESFVPNIVVLGITRELGPVFAGLMLAGRVSAGIAAELGAMRVSQQIDALYTLSVPAERYLVAPRVIAGVLVLPLLVLIADILGVMGGWLVATTALDFNGQVYLENTLSFVTAGDIISGLIKAAVFGFIITVMGCRLGLTAGGGAVGVGRSATLAVVSAAMLIFAANYLLTSLFVGIGL